MVVIQPIKTYQVQGHVLEAPQSLPVAAFLMNVCTCTISCQRLTLHDPHPIDKHSITLHTIALHTIVPHHIAQNSEPTVPLQHFLPMTPVTIGLCM